MLMDASRVADLANEIRESEQPDVEHLQMLRSLRVQLVNPVLPQHEIETRSGSRPPTHSEVQRFKEITKLKKGTFSAREDFIISTNWEKFCKLHKWNHQDVAPFLLLKLRHRMYIRSQMQRRKFVQFLADGLPHRTLYSVYHRFRNLYNGHIQKRYTKEEDRLILSYLENNPNLDVKRKYTDLAKVLKRTRASIWRRYKLLVKKRE